MVATVSAIVVVLTLAAAGDQPGAGVEKVTVSVLAVKATNEGRTAPREESAPTAKKPKPATAPLLQQGFAPGLRESKAKPKANGNGDHRSFEEGLEAIRDATQKLPFDTYRKVRSETSPIAFGAESQLEINARYTLRLKPLDKDSEGRVRINVAVDERTDASQTIKALDTTLALVPNKYAVLGGRFPLDEGQLVICVVTQP